MVISKEKNELSSPFCVTKLNCHLRKINEITKWVNHQNRETVPYPITVELDLVANCNQACRWCDFRSWSKKRKFLSLKNISSLFKELAVLGIKAVEIVGGGESLLHPQFKDIVKQAQLNKLELGLVTNGTLLSKIYHVASYFTFIRISLDAATPKTYYQNHYYWSKNKFSDKLFFNVLKQIENLKKYIANKNIGIAFLITPWNYREIVACAELAKKIGVGYIVYRPLGNQNSKIKYPNNYWQVVEANLKQVKELENQSFKVYQSHESRWQFAQKKRKNVGHCVGSLLYSVIEPTGNIPFCNLLRGFKKYSIGNIYESGSFSEIWRGEKHQQLFKKINIIHCPRLCKANDYTLYINNFPVNKWGKLKRSHYHQNFL